MTAIKKKAIIFAVAFLMIVSSALGLSFASRTSAVAVQDVFTSVGGATVEYGQVANVKTITHNIKKDVDGNVIEQTTEEKEFDIADGKKGIKLSVNNDSKIRFDSNKGIFDLKFKGVSAVGERTITSQPEKLDDVKVQKLDLTTVRFDFVSANNPEDSFYVRFDQIEEGTLQSKINVRVYYKEVVNTYILYSPSSEKNDPSGLSHVTLNGNDYLNNGDILGIKFNPFDMTISYTNGQTEQLVVDFDDANSMKKNFTSLNTMGRIDEYDVTMSAIVTGESATIMLYEFNGVALDGDSGESVIENNNGPVMDTRINDVDGVVGYAYDLNLSKINMYDVIDGYTVFSGDVEITAPNGQVIEHQNGIFTPSIAGIYSIKFTPKDIEQVVGKAYTMFINVLSEYPESTVETHYEISDGLVNGNKVKLPSASISSSLQGSYDDQIKVYATIRVNDNEIIKDASTDFIVDVSGANTFTVQYYAIDGLGTKLLSKVYTLNNNGATVNVESINATYVIGDYVYAKNTAGTIGHEIISPSGKISSYEKVRVDEIGLWSVNYYYENGGKTCTYTQYFDGVESPANLFVTGRGMTLENNKSTPDYFMNQTTGIQAVATTPYASATYKNTINVSEYTKEDTLIKFFPTPLVEESNEIKEITVKLSDVENSENDITVEFFLHPFFSYQSLGVRVFVNGEMIARDQSYRKYNLSTYLGYSSFHGKITSEKGRVHPNNPIGVTLDYQSKTLYVFNDYEYSAVKLDDPNTIGKGNEWQGFTGGEAKVSYIYSSITQTAYSLILAIDNIGLTDEFVTDTTAPGVAVDFDANYAPKAEVGKKFPAMSAYGVDSIDGRLNDVKVSVSRVKDGLTFIVPVNADNSFVPTEAGEYVIKYSVTDRSGNVGTRSVSIQAVNALEPLGLDVDLKDIYPSDMLLGQRFSLVPANGKGGSGFVSVKRSVIFNGEELSINGVIVEPEIAGVYTIVYTLTDYLGQTDTVEHNITVTRSDRPIFSETVIPEAVMAGRAFKIPERTAILYTEAGKNTVEVETFIDGVKVDKVYTPTEFNKEKPEEFKDSFNLTYRVGDYEETSNIKVLSTKKDKSVPFIASFFNHDENINAVNSEQAYEWQYMKFNVKADSKMFFANAIGGYEFTLKFMLENKHNNIGKINFILQDKINSTQKVVITTMKNPDATKTTGLVSVNGGLAVDFGGDYTQNSPSGVVLSVRGNNLSDADGKVVATIDKTATGEDFNGFTSEYVYLTIEFVDVTASSEFNFISINNQTFSVEVDKDRMAPSMVYYTDFVPTGTRGTAYTFADIWFYDVLDDYTSAHLTIYSPTSETVYDGDFVRKYTFTPNEYGDYSVEIKFGDSFKETKRYHIINVADDRKPDMVINGNVPTSANNGDTIKLPEAKVGDDFNLFVYVSDPLGRTIIVYKQSEYFGEDESQETFKFYEFKATQKGTYKVTYYAYSDGGIYNIQTYKIKVK